MSDRKYHSTAQPRNPERAQRGLMYLARYQEFHRPGRLGGIIADAQTRFAVGLPLTWWQRLILIFV